ncbi:MAG TPA: hypothetical protein DCF45_02305 [Gammaproteobacteria bacterium]|nr:hypothetical protein [Gammaproteobacteria bacterium]
MKRCQLVKQVRISSRFRQALLLAVASLAAVPLLQAEEGPAGLDQALIKNEAEYQLPAALEALKRWIAIPSITDATDSYRSDKTRLLKSIVAEAEQLGFNGQLVADEQVAVIDINDQPPSIGILLHADVVPPGDESQWQYPPFSAIVADGAVWGRGAADDKGPIAATLYALAGLKRLGIELAGGVRVIIGTSEENMLWGDFEQVATLGLAPTRGWTADAMFPVVHAEKSFVNARVSFHPAPVGEQGLITQFRGGTAPNSVPDRASLRLGGTSAEVEMAIAKYVAERPEVSFEFANTNGGVEITAFGKAGHGSRPASGVNAITHLARLVASLIELKADSSAAERAILFLGPLLAGETDGSSLGIARTHPVMGSTTVNVGQVETDGRSTHCYLNIRGPIGLSAQEIEQALMDKTAPLGGQVTMVAAMDSLWVDPDDEFVTQLVESYRRWQHDDRPPVAIGGTTYAKAFPGYVAFGMGLPDHRVPVHAPNERLPLAALERGMAIYMDAIAATVGVIGNQRR